MRNLLRTLDITQIKEGGRNVVKVKLKGSLGSDLSKLMSILFIIMFLGIVLIFFFALKTINFPLIFKIVIPLIIGIAFFIIIFGFITRASMRVFLSKNGNKLFVKRVVFPISYEETVALKKGSKLVLVKFIPLSTFGRYQLLIKSGKYLEVLVPKAKWYRLLKHYLFYSPGTAMRSFIYTKEDAMKISKLLKIPLEISNKEIVAYVKDFK